MDDSIAGLRSASWVEALYPPEVAAKELYGFVSPAHLLADEHKCVEGAVEKRRQQFTAGRVCARSALVTLGFPESPLLAANDRTPVWPSGATGCISHTDFYCVGVTGLTRDFAGLGVDTEMLDRVDPSLWKLIFREEELRQLQSRGESQQIEVATVMFSAKEAFYKCQFSITRSWLDFADMTIEIAGDYFQVLVHNDKVRARLAAQLFIGKYAIHYQRVVCGIAIETPQRDRSSTAAS